MTDNEIDKKIHDSEQKLNILLVQLIGNITKELSILGGRIEVLEDTVEVINYNIRDFKKNISNIKKQLRDEK